MPNATRLRHVLHTDVMADRPAWASQIQRAMEEFKISTERMPSELIAAMAMVKRAYAAATQGAHAGLSRHDEFAAALQVAVSAGMAHSLLPALASLRTELLTKIAANGLAPKTTVHVAQLAEACDLITATLPSIQCLPLAGQPRPDSGRPTEPGQEAARTLTDALGLHFLASLPDGATSAASTDTLIALHGHLKSVAVSLMTIASDVQHVIRTEADPAQCEALTMVCCQVTGNDVMLTIGAASPRDSKLLNPLVAQQLLQSIRLLTDATTSFTEYVLRGTPMTHGRISDGLATSLMLVTSRVSQVA